MSAKSNAISEKAGTGGQSTKSNTEGQVENVNALSLPPYDIALLKKTGITIGKVLGKGSFSTVCQANFNGKAMAAKIIDLSKTSPQYEKKFLPRELYAMTKLSHPNIITVHKIHNIRELRIYIIMDLADGGDILDLIKGGAVSELKAKPLYRGIADALRYIHEEGFAHRDIKCENILLNKDRTVAKISDFGFSRTCFVNQTGERLLSNTYCGSAAYAAPEILKVKPYNAMISDVWSLGVVLYVMVNCRLPFSDKNIKEILKQQLKNKIEYKQKLSELCKDLIGHHLDPDIKSRYTMKQVLKHKWFD